MGDFPIQINKRIISLLIDPGKKSDLIFFYGILSTDENGGTGCPILRQMTECRCITT